MVKTRSAFGLAALVASLITADLFVERFRVRQENEHLVIGALQEKTGCYDSFTLGERDVLTDRMCFPLPAETRVVEYEAYCKAVALGSYRVVSVPLSAQGTLSGIVGTRYDIQDVVKQ